MYNWHTAQTLLWKLSHLRNIPLRYVGLYKTFLVHVSNPIDFPVTDVTLHNLSCDTCHTVRTFLWNVSELASVVQCKLSCDTSHIVETCALYNISCDKCSIVQKFFWHVPKSPSFILCRLCSDRGTVQIGTCRIVKTAFHTFEYDHVSYFTKFALTRFRMDTPHTVQHSMPPFSHCTQFLFTRVQRATCHTILKQFDTCSNWHAWMCRNLSGTRAQDILCSADKKSSLTRVLLETCQSVRNILLNMATSTHDHIYTWPCAHVLCYPKISSNTCPYFPVLWFTKGCLKQVQCVTCHTVHNFDETGVECDRYRTALF